jgi:hypothetical protein
MSCAHPNPHTAVMRPIKLFDGLLQSHERSR